MHLLRSDSKEKYSWGRGPSAAVELREWPDGRRAIVKRYGPEDGHRNAMWREYLALTFLRTTHVVPKVLKLMPKSRVLVLEWIPGVTILEWVLRRYGVAEASVQRFIKREPVKKSRQAMDIFEQFQQSMDPDCVRLREAVRSAYDQIHRRHVVHNDVKPANIILEGGYSTPPCSVVLVDFESATVRWDAARRDRAEFEMWLGNN